MAKTMKKAGGGMVPMPSAPMTRTARPLKGKALPRPPEPPLPGNTGMAMGMKRGGKVKK